MLETRDMISNEAAEACVEIYGPCCVDDQSRACCKVLINRGIQTEVEVREVAGDALELSVGYERFNVVV